MPQHLLDNENIAGVIVEALRKLLRRLCRQMPVQTRSLKSHFQNIVCSASRHPLSAPTVPRRKQRTGFMCSSVLLTMSSNQRIDRKSAVSVHGDSTTQLSTLDDGFVEKQILYRGTVLVDISDL